VGEDPSRRIQQPDETIETTHDARTVGHKFVAEDNDDAARSSPPLRTTSAIPRFVAAVRILPGKHERSLRLRRCTIQCVP